MKTYQTLLFVFLLGSSSADLHTWTGDGVNNLWDNLANWEPPTVPTDADDVVIPDGVDILIGTAGGANAASLTIGASRVSLSGCSAKVTGDLKISSGGNVFVNAGDGILSVKGTSTISSGSQVIWTSGSMEGDWGVNAGALLKISGFGNQLYFKSGSITNLGNISVQDSTNLNVNATIKNGGQITFSGLQSKPTEIQNFPCENIGGGKLTVSGTVTTRTLTASNVAIEGQLIVLAGGNINLQTVRVSETGWVVVNEPSHANFTDFQDNGILQLVGGSAFADFYGPTTISTIECLLGNAFFYSHVDVKSLTALGGSIGVSETASIGNLVGNGTFSLGGRGVVTVQDAVLTTYITIRSRLVVKNSLKISSKELTLDGELQVEPSATVFVGGEVGHWGPSTSKRPGQIVNNGVLSFTNPNTTINGLTYSGGGSIVVLDGVLDLQAMNVSVSSVTLSSQTAVVKGSTLTLSYKSFLGPKAGSLVKMIINDVLSQCVSPCPEKTTLFPYQVFRAWVQ